jgi:hypothetical protein
LELIWRAVVGGLLVLVILLLAWTFFQRTHLIVEPKMPTSPTPQENPFFPAQ